MNLTTYVYLMVGLCIAGWLFGATNIYNAMTENQGSSPKEPLDFVEDLIKEIPTNTTLQLILGSVLLGAGLGIAGGGINLSSLTTAFSAGFIISLGILAVVLSNFVFPFSFIVDPALPPFLKNIIILLFNLLTMLTVIGWVRTGA